MWKNVVVAKSWDDGDYEVVGGIGVIIIVCFAKDLDKLVHHEPVKLCDLFVCSRISFIIIMSSRVSRPHNKIDLVFQILFNPLESCVDKGQGRIATRDFGAIVSRGALAAMARLFRIRMNLVERIRVNVCTNI